MTTSNNTLNQVVADLVLGHPFFAAMVLRMERIEDNGEDVTMYTDGKRIWYSSAFIEKIGRKCTLGVFAHEAAHVFLKHHLRKGSRDRRLWNIACDAVVNAIILDSGFKLPSGGVPPVRGKTAEQVYDELEKKEQKEQEEQEREGEDGNASSPNKPPDEGHASDGEGAPSTPSDGGHASDSEGTPSTPEKMEPPKGKPSLQPHQQRQCEWGAVEQQGGLDSEADMERAEQECNVLIKQAATAAKRAGKMPLGLQLEIDRITEPRVDWKDVLSKFIGERAKSDYSWQRPNPRYFGSGVILPSLDSYGIGKVVMACDTSGSMIDVVSEICSEVVGAMEVYEEQGQSPEVSVLWCDTDVTEQTITDASELKPTGGGGTDFAPVFKAVRERHADAKAVVYITDGYCNSFGVEPDCPVLWVLTQTNNGFTPPFGEVITIQSKHN